MSNKLKILIHAIDGDGHVNACTGLGQKLQSRGHTIIFVTNQSFKHKLDSFGFLSECYSDQNRDQTVNSAENWAKIMMSSGMMSDLSSLDKFKARVNTGFFHHVFELGIQNESFIKECVQRHDPHLIIVDNLFLNPSLIFSGKPWIRLWSANPLSAFNSDRLPPQWSGYSTEDTTNWTEFRNIQKNYYEKLNNDINNYYYENGYPVVDSNRLLFDSPFLNLYCFPEELDYSDIISIPNNYIRMDKFMRTESGTFDIPMNIKTKTGKLIYFSLGSMGAINVELMEKLIKILSKSQHKYIVSKGPLHYKYKLADNMYGEKFLPQTLILPLVDLIITHGGNNTVTEAFNFGKPMIIMPLFADQFDNAQRIQEKGFGIRLDPFNVTENELLAAIEMLLNNESIKEKFGKISKRIQTEDNTAKAIDCIETLVL